MQLKLVKIVSETSDVKSFFWEPDTPIEWVPGQYLYYTLPKLTYTDARGETRHFTISSSPTEGSLLRLTTKFPTPMSGYKKTLLELKIGDVIEGRGPQGTFIINNLQSTMNNVFIAGGIGITPFRSIIKYNFDKNLPLPYLIYSNSDENFTFRDELKSWLGDKVEFIDTFKSGHIDQLKIAELIKNWKLPARNAFSIADAGGLIVNCTFYVVGPPKFVDAMEQNLEELGVHADNVTSEKFTGY